MLGKGYLAMLLSELLPKDKVSRIVPRGQGLAAERPGRACGAPDQLGNTRTQRGLAHHINDLEARFKMLSVRGMKRRVLDEAPGDIVVLAVHLCGTLSLALDLFNSHEKCSFLVLKPCCLPGLVHSKRDEVFVVGDHAFSSKEVCSNGRVQGQRLEGACSTVGREVRTLGAEPASGAQA